MAEIIPYPYGAHPRALIQCDEVTFHQITVSGPGGGGFIHPVSQIGDNDSELLRRTSKVKETNPQLNCLCSQRPRGA